MSAPTMPSIAIHSVPEPAAPAAPPREGSEEQPFESLLESPPELTDSQQFQEAAPAASQPLEIETVVELGENALADYVALAIVEGEEAAPDLDSIVLSAQLPGRAKPVTQARQQTPEDHQPEVAEDVVAQSLAGLSIIVPASDFPEATIPLVAAVDTAESTAPEMIVPLASTAEPATQAPLSPLPIAPVNPGANPTVRATAYASVQSVEKLEIMLPPASPPDAPVELQPAIETAADLPPEFSADQTEDARIALPTAGNPVQQLEKVAVALPPAAGPVPPAIVRLATKPPAVTEKKRIDEAATPSTPRVALDVSPPDIQVAPEIDVTGHDNEPAAREEMVEPLAAQTGNQPSGVNLPESTISNYRTTAPPAVVEPAAPVVSTPVIATSIAAQPLLAPSSSSVQFPVGETLGPSRADRHAAVEIDTVRLLARVARAFTAAQQRDGEIRLRLSPPELGTLQIQVHVHEGALTARLEAETSTARTALIDNLPALRERLAEQGVRVERFDVDLMQRHAGGAPDRRGDQPGEPAPVFRTPQAASSRPEQSPALRPILVPADSTGRLNVIV